MTKNKLIGISLYCCVIYMVLFSGTSCKNQELTGEINIVAPANQSQVVMEQQVRGEITGYSRGNVYSLVHPILTDLWYVQRPPSVISANGSWQTVCYFGTETEGIGHKYELIAIITNKKLKAGETIGMNELPKDAIKSPIVNVTRPKYSK